MNLSMDEVVNWIPLSVFSDSAAGPEGTALQWTRIRAAIDRAIAPFSGAHEAVMQALEVLANDW